MPMICVYFYIIVLNQMTMRMTRTKRDDYGDDDKAKTFFHFPVESASIHTPAS